jgi:hypothetical protein
MEEASKRTHDKAKGRFIKRVVDTLREKYATELESDAPWDWISPPIKIPKNVGSNVLVSKLIHEGWDLYDCKPVKGRSIILQRAYGNKYKYKDIAHPDPRMEWFFTEVNSQIKSMQKELREQRTADEMEIREEQFNRGCQEITLSRDPSMNTKNKLRSIGWDIKAFEGGYIVYIPTVV